MTSSKYLDKQFRGAETASVVNEHGVQGITEGGI